MKRTVIIFIWLCAAAALAILLREPARRLYVVVRLWRKGTEGEAQEPYPLPAMQ